MELSTTIEGRAVASAAAVVFRGKVPFLSSYGRTHSGNASGGWISGAFALPAAGLCKNFLYFCISMQVFIHENMLLGSQGRSGTLLFFTKICIGSHLNVFVNCAQSHIFDIEPCVVQSLMSFYYEILSMFWSLK